MDGFVFARLCFSIACAMGNKILYGLDGIGWDMDTAVLGLGSSRKCGSSYCKNAIRSLRSLPHLTSLKFLVLSCLGFAAL